MRLTGRGDERIRATHAKTMELTPDASITARATCVIAVDARADRAAPVPAGPVTITVEAGEESFSFDAHANSSWSPSGPAVIRRSALALPGTLATRADASSADLPRALVDAMREPGAAVRVDVAARRGLDALVLFAAHEEGSTDPRLAGELAVADAVFAEDAGARTAIAAAGGSAGARRPEVLPPGRVLVVATADLPGASLPENSLDARPIETVGLPARLAVAAATRARGPLTFAAFGSDAVDALRRAPAGRRLVVCTPYDRLGTLVDAVRELRGAAAVVVAQQHMQPVSVRGPVPTLPSKDVVHCCLEPAPENDTALDPTVRAALMAMLADGVSTRTAARALAELTGWPRRRAYDVVLGLGTCP